MTTGRTRLCCLIGDPVVHSLSPRMFSAAFSKIKIDYAYMAFRVRPKDLLAAIRGLQALEFVGCNVTMPHKIAVVKHMDRLEGAARLIGSVNVVAYVNGELIGHNTDGSGVLAALDLERVEINKRRVLLVGYGGAARAVAFEMASNRKPAELLVAGRHRAKADGLAKELKPMVQARGVMLDDKVLLSQGADVIINATPMGMRPRIHECPIPEPLLGPEVTVLDLVYDPVETRLLHLAKERGCKVVNGLEVLVQQGAMTFKIWTGLNAPIEEMRKAAEGGIA
jgi:shikimate dehydrogenase